MQLQTKHISLQGCVNLILRHFLLSLHPNALAVYCCTLYRYTHLFESLRCTFESHLQQFVTVAH